MPARFATCGSAEAQRRKEISMEILATERTLTELDHVRLMNIINRISRGESAELGTQDVERVLDTAVLVPSRGMAADIVTMYSQVLLSDIRTGRQRKLTVC